MFALFGILFLVVLTRSIDKIKNKIIEQTSVFQDRDNKSLCVSNLETVLNTRKILNMKILIMLLMFAILWTCGTFALAYIIDEKVTIIKTIAFYSRILVSIVFCVVVISINLTLVDMSRIF